MIANPKISWQCRHDVPGGTINPFTGTPKERHNTFAHMVTKNLLPLPPRRSIMWKLALYMLYATGFLASVSAGLGAPPPQAPLNSCVLTVQSTVGKVANPQAIIGYGAFVLSRPRAERNV